MGQKKENEVRTEVLISASVSRTIEIEKQWYKFEYKEERTVWFKDLKVERNNLWADCIDEVEMQIVALKKYLGVK